MFESTTTQCVVFPGLLDKPLVAHFDQPHGSSDGDAILLKAADRRLRLFGIACGYSDANDAARLVHDPVHKLLLDRDPLEGDPLASQPTLSRF